MLAFGRKETALACPDGWSDLEQGEERMRYLQSCLVILSGVFLIGSAIFITPQRFSGRELHKSTSRFLNFARPYPVLTPFKVGGKKTIFLTDKNRGGCSSKYINSNEGNGSEQERRREARSFEMLHASDRGWPSTQGRSQGARFSHHDCLGNTEKTHG